VAGLAVTALVATPVTAGAAGTPSAAAPTAAAPTLQAQRASAPPAGALRVATFNVAKSTVRTRGFHWGVRRLALVRVVNATRPDVLMVQEANTQRWKGVRHIDDVIGLMRSAGYQIASTAVDNCNPGCTRGAHVFFNPQRVALPRLPSGMAPAGMTGQSNIAGTWSSSIQERATSWAFLKPHGSSRVTLYVSVHLPTPKTATGEALRLAIANRLKPWAARLIAASGLPRAELVIGGDFNSYDKRQPQGAQQVLRDAGLHDGWLAPVKVNPNYSTVNITPSTRKYKGFPPRPHFYKQNTTRIDYVFASVPPLRHEVFLRFTAKGTIDNAYRASDHNMVLVDLPLA
jgi:endonuclease/exonuclease/phosphatase family metal-dependent hydrolase